MFADKTRVDLAATYRALGPCSIETARNELGWSDGRARKPTDDMATWGVLIAGSSPTGRGKVYSFNRRDWGTRLDAALARPTPGLLCEGQRTILIRNGAGPALDDLEKAQPSGMAWFARFDDDDSGLVALDLTAPLAQARALRDLLTASGAATELHRAVDILGK